VNRKQRIEEMSEPDAISFGNESELSAVTVKTPGPAVGDDLKRGLAVTVEEFAS